jgi:CRISPR-associated endonuclease Cas2
VWDRGPHTNLYGIFRHTTSVHVNGPAEPRPRGAAYSVARHGFWHGLGERLWAGSERLISFVQFSVFECDLADLAQVGQVKTRLRELIDPAEDQVRLYPLPSNADRSAEIIGNRRLEERADFWIL